MKLKKYRHSLIFKGIDIIDLIMRVLTDKATAEDQKLFASFCGKNLRNWQDVKKALTK